jgi:hypothetical protein
VTSLQDLLLDSKGRKDAGIIGFRNETTTELIRGDCAEVYDRLLIGKSRLPTSHKALRCYSWFESFFNQVGDFIPNSNEIHLEKCDKKDIYNIFVSEMRSDYEDDAIVTYSYFLKIWKECFPHVKVREYKAVTGKCQCCTILTELRSKSQKPAVRKRVTNMHAFHRSLYMSERNEYYKKQKQAVDDPSNYMRIIIDGMAQNHTTLPYLANMKQFPSPFTMHLQGILLELGQNFTMYRSFAIVISDSNLAIHCILLQLEKRYQLDGKLPSTIYIQIDGGSENANNKCLLGLCEYLVATRLTKKVYI